jgi:pimeloyl-ACP methyl ester carboxylesterase
MPVVDNSGVNIHYEVVGSGKPLVLAHGLFGSIKFLTNRGWVDALSSEFQLIIPEMRAHGESDTPADQTHYSLKHRMSDVIAVMDDAGIDSAAYYGYSMGSIVGFGLAGNFSERFNTFVLGGAHPYPKDLSWVKNIVNDRRTQGLAPDVPDLTPFFTILDHDEEGTGVDPSQIQSPCLIFCGGSDPNIDGVHRVAKEVPNCEYLELPGLGHRDAFEPSDELVHAVLSFLREHA